jgi:hypothetical protein
MTDKIKYSRGYKYQLEETFVINIPIKPEKPCQNKWASLNSEGRLVIEEGYAWDGPSGPTFDTKNFMRGSLVHDILYQFMG